MANDSELAIAKLFGFDLEAERAKRKQEFIDYTHLLETMNESEFIEEIVKRFGMDIYQASIIAMIYLKNNA